MRAYANILLIMGWRRRPNKATERTFYYHRNSRIYGHETVDVRQCGIAGSS
jgi:hypothetical protein